MGCEDELILTSGVNRETWHSTIPRIPRRPAGLKTWKNHHESTAVAISTVDAGYVSSYGLLYWRSGSYVTGSSMVFLEVLDLWSLKQTQPPGYAKRGCSQTSMKREKKPSRLPLAYLPIVLRDHN